MIDPSDLDRLLGWMQAAGLQSLSVRENARSVTLRLDCTPAAIRSAQAVADHAPCRIVSRGIGRFVAAHPRRPAAEVTAGSSVISGQTVGFLECGATLTAIVADRAGVVAEILVGDGDLIGFGTPILTIERAR